MRKDSRTSTPEQGREGVFTPTADQELEAILAKVILYFLQEILSTTFYLEIVIIKFSLSLSVCLCLSLEREREREKERDRDNYYLL